MRSATEYLIETLGDGQARTAADMADELGVTVDAIYQAASRLSRKGVAVVSAAGVYRLDHERRCLACDRPLGRHNRTGLCEEHRHEPKRRHQQMVLTV